MFHPEPRNRKTAQRIEKVILQNISNKQFSVAMLSTELDICESHLRETVYRCFSMSPQKLIEAIKLQKAIFLLSDDSSLQFVTERIGYTSKRTLRRVFNKRLQISPSECRQLLNSDSCNGLKIKQLLRQLWKTTPR